MPRRPNPFSTASLDRLGVLRKDQALLGKRLADVTSPPLVLPISGARVAVRGNPAALAMAALDAIADHHEPWLLGEIDGRLVVAVDLGTADVDDDLLGDEDARWAGLREVGGLLPADDANMLATATGLATWHRTHRYCGACGQETRSDWAGHRRMCDGCGREHFPRTDPAIIVLVTHDDRCLLARNPAWPPRFASTLAGFVEPGESLEDAVAREVYEEVGLRLDRDSITYHSSQPWPFPSSVMLGFTAEALDEKLTPDPEEVADAAWWTAEDIRDGAIGVPPPVSIARRLIDDWVSAQP
jgi:NAD+ diphosphatase